MALTFEFNGQEKKRQERNMRKTKEWKEEEEEEGRETVCNNEERFPYGRSVVLFTFAFLGCCRLLNLASFNRRRLSVCV